MYKKRIIEDTLNRYLKTFKAVALVGPKFCGKTTLSEKFTQSSVMLTPLNVLDYKTMLQLNAKTLFLPPYPKLIDEWQLIPELWDILRHQVDHLEGRGLFILTGSSAANIEETSHSGAGRIGRLMLRPMSLFESIGYKTPISLHDLFQNIKIEYTKSSLNVLDYAKWIIKGGWPESIEDPEDVSILKMQSYVDALLKEDINKVTGKRYNEQRMQKILESLARYTASETSNTNILRDLEGIDTSTAPNTLLDYLDVLKKLYIIEDLKAWNPNIRSKTTIRSTSARFFVDPSLGAAVLKLNSQRLLNDFETFGLFFEALAIRDLRIYAQHLHGEVYRYKDKNGLEVDAIIELNDGRWGAIEIKMGSHTFDRASKKLLQFRDIIDTKKMNPPSFLAIVTATEYAYQRDDGIYILPLGLLKE